MIAVEQKVVASAMRVDGPKRRARHEEQDDGNRMMGTGTTAASAAFHVRWARSRLAMLLHNVAGSCNSGESIGRFADGDCPLFLPTYEGAIEKSAPSFR